MADMKDIINKHMHTHLDGRGLKSSLYTCECGDPIYVPKHENPADVFAEHLADKLEQAGYGPLV